MTENKDSVAPIGTYDHTGFVTSDIQATLAFWRDGVGLTASEIVERGGVWVAEMTGVPGARLAILHLTGPGIHLEFLSFLSGGEGGTEVVPTQPAVGHVCLRVDDPAAALDRLLAAGGRPLGRVAVITEGAIAGKRGVYLRDPNGVLIELLETVAP